jgi:Signal transduction histidine kinase regulating citrate/malate metabolism
MQSTFHSMAEAVLVIDTKGRVLLSNPAAEKMLRYRPGMTVELLRSLSTVFRADGVTPLSARDMPASRALRGEEFDATEIVVRPAAATRRSISSSAAGRCATLRAPSRRGAALSRHHRQPATPSASCCNRKSSTPSASSPAASPTTSTTC